MAGVAGITSSRVCGCTVRPASTFAANRMSSMRPLVQVPMKHWSTRTPAASRTGTTLPGDAGTDTTGSSVDTSYSRTSTYLASASLRYTVRGRRARGRIHSSTRSSGSMMPFLAPASTAMDVSDPRTTDIVEMGQMMRCDEIAGDLALLRRGDVFVRDVVIEDEREPVGIEHLPDAHLLELLDRQRRGDVVGKQEVDRAVDEVAGAYLRPAGMDGENLLGNRHPHRQGVSHPIIARSEATTRFHPWQRLLRSSGSPQHWHGSPAAALGSC